MSKKILECVYSNEEFQILKYKPSLMQLFYIDMEPMTLKRRIRFMVDYIYGYSVYYLKKCGGGRNHRILHSNQWKKSEILVCQK